MASAAAFTSSSVTEQVKSFQVLYPCYYYYCCWYCCCCYCCWWCVGMSGGCWVLIVRRRRRRIIINKKKKPWQDVVQAHYQDPGSPPPTPPTKHSQPSCFQNTKQQKQTQKRATLFSFYGDKRASVSCSGSDSGSGSVFWMSNSIFENIRFFVFHLSPTPPPPP